MRSFTVTGQKDMMLSVLRALALRAKALASKQWSNAPRPTRGSALLIVRRLLGVLIRLLEPSHKRRRRLTNRLAVLLLAALLVPSHDGLLLEEIQIVQLLHQHRGLLHEDLPLRAAHQIGNACKQETLRLLLVRSRLVELAQQLGMRAKLLDSIL